MPIRPAVSTQELRKLASNLQFVQASLNKGHGTKTANAGRQVFLSHSHKDKDLIQGGGIFLLNLIPNIYVDWLDQDMPETTSHVTAKTIKEKIKQFSKFILLATPNALASRWVPWELGVADGLIGYEHMAILAVDDGKTSYSGNEYMGLYNWIGKADCGGWGVFDPESDRGLKLEEWINK